jgi:hypothetical protein
MLMMHELDVGMESSERGDSSKIDRLVTQKACLDRLLALGAR